MLTAISFFYGQVDGDRASTLDDDDFTCPNCNAKVILRNGLIKIAHFAHQTKSSCEYAGESYLHIQMKKQIYQYLTKSIGNRVKAIYLEKNLHSVRPDILIEGKKSNVAIEVQASALTPEEILHRTKKYKLENTYVIWIIPYDSNRFLQKNPTTGTTIRSVRLKEYEKIISQMSFKSLLLWDVDNTEDGFISFKLGDSYTPSVEYYDRDAGEHIYHNPKKLKSIKEIIKIKRNIPLSEITLRNLNEFEKEGMKYALPSRKIGFYNWIDKK